jgi:hypothetical protein
VFGSSSSVSQSIFARREYYLSCLNATKPFHAVIAAVARAMEHTPRSSSLVENINSRLRPHFTLRRHLGAPYLDLLRFFFNHRRFMRSRRAERKDRSPCELMTGQKHPHWLGLLLLQPQRT